MEDNTRYLVRCEEASDWVRHVDEGTQIVNDFYLPQGPFEKNEMSDTIYHAGTKVNYHEHSQGYETFFIARGSVECTIRGKKAVAQTGDIVHLPPYTPHGFVFLEEGTIWRELFQEINMQQGILNKNMILKHYPDLYEDPEFIGMYREANGSFVREKEVQDIAPVVPKSEIPEIREPGFAWARHCGDGWELKLKVGRFECNGAKEVWEANLDEGITIEYQDPHPYFELYYITKGKVRFTILEGFVDEAVFVAEAGSIVRIPPYAKHKIEVVEAAQLFDNGCEIRLMSMLEDLAAIRTARPQVLEDPVMKKKLLRKYKCFVTAFYKKA